MKTIQAATELQKAISLLKEKEWLDLTHTFGPVSPHFAAFDDAAFKTLFTHDDGFFAQQFSFKYYLKTKLKSERG